VDAQQETGAAISYGGVWTPQSVTSAYGGALQYTTVTGAKATFGFTGLDVSWVAPKGPDRGKAEVWVDGAKVRTVDLYASAAQPRKAVYTQSWGVPGSHTLEVGCSAPRERLRAARGRTWTPSHRCASALRRDARER